MADFEDFFRPIRSYFYWEKHCFDIPVCWSLRSVFDGLDGIDTMTDDIESLLPVMDNLDKLMPQLTALMPEMIANMKDMKTTMLTMYSTQKGLQDQQNESQKNSAAMGKAFDESKNDDSFYLPPETFKNAEFKRGMKNFISPDGHAVRFIISHQGDPMTPEGISHIDAIKHAAKEALKGTPLEGSKIYLGGTAATFKDMGDGSNYDLLIAGIASLCLIFIIMLIITRSVVASAVIVGTVLALAGRVVRAFGAHLAAPDRHRAALDGARDVGHHPARRRRRLQPAAGVAVQRGDPRRPEHRDHPVDGRHRIGGHLGRAGVRLHDDDDGGQSADGDRPGRNHHRARSALRHADRAVADDAVHRRADGQVVLVAAGSPAAAEAVTVADARWRRRTKRW